MVSTRSVGNNAEDLAEKYLKKLGYKILKRNYTIRGGEIDIIAQDKEELVFIEVKARYSHNFGLPIESITYFKMKALLKTAAIFANLINWGNKPYRIDLVTIDFDPYDQRPNIELIKNIMI